MAKAETVILKELWDVDRRLAEFKLMRNKLLKVRDVALTAGADATPFHPANAEGTLQYHFGTFALRNEFVGDDWKVCRRNGVEAIRNETLKLSVVFTNVDVACQDQFEPKPRSHKGSGAERVCQGNLFPWLPSYTEAQSKGEATFYLMVAQDGATELTRVVVEDGTFVEYVERIYLSDGDDLKLAPGSLDDAEVADNFDPQVVRK